jgi:putative ABC transport system substrate-binding protein
VKRRRFITLLSGAATWPLVARAQRGDQIPRIAVLTNLAEGDPELLRRVKVFEQALEALGWTGARKLQIDYFWNTGTLGRAEEAVAELMKHPPQVIFAAIGPALIAAKAATATIPIVFAVVSEPVSRGFVQSLSHPGGNITGFANMEPTLGSKWLALLKEIAPGVARVAVVFNPETGAAKLFFRSIEEVAQNFAVEVVMAAVHGPMEIASAIETFARQPNGGLINLPDGFSTTYYKLFIELAARYRLPAVYSSPIFAPAGGLASYAPSVIEQYRQAAGYIDRILRGEKPADLPVQQATKFELVINLKTAKALGLQVSPDMLSIADEVIE